jgi:hypothetical protein
MITLTYDFVKNYIESFAGHKLISADYKGSLDKIDILCPCGEIFCIQYSAFQQGQRHRYCKLKDNKWKKRQKENPILFSEDAQKLIVRRHNGKAPDEHTGRNKIDKLTVKCVQCNTEYQSNEYDFSRRKHYKCDSCMMSEKWQNEEYKKMILDERIKNHHYEKIQESSRNSDVWWETRKIMGQKRTLRNNEIRGCTMLEARSTWFVYKKIVYGMSEKTYRRYKNLINPENLARGKHLYHLDHKFSVLDGFRNNIAPHVMACAFNLQMLPAKENIAKDYHSEITIDELFQGVQKYDYCV